MDPHENYPHAAAVPPAGSPAFNAPTGAPAYPGSGPMYWNPQPPPRRGLLPVALGCFFTSLIVVPVLLVVLALIGSVANLGTAEPKIEEHYHSLNRAATDKIAIISIEGAILDGDGFVKQQIDHIRDDPTVKAVVLRINSPGGTVTASDYLYHHLKKLAADREMPIVVSMGGVCASGGYYIAMSVGHEERVIFAEPTTWTGSIGVIIPHYNLGGLMKHWEIEEDSIKSGPLKEMGTISRAMTPEEREVFEHLVADSFSRFRDIVRSGRATLAKSDEALDKVTTGQVFTTQQAIADGLVDGEGFIEEAIDRAIELGGTTRDHVKVVKYKRRGGLFGFPMAAEARSYPDLRTLVDVASPRAYYLFSWLPPLSSQP